MNMRCECRKEAFESFKLRKILFKKKSTEKVGIENLSNGSVAQKGFKFKLYPLFQCIKKKEIGTNKT